MLDGGRSMRCLWQELLRQTVGRCVFINRFVSFSPSALVLWASVIGRKDGVSACRVIEDAGAEGVLGNPTGRVEDGNFQLQASNSREPSSFKLQPPVRPRPRPRPRNRNRNRSASSATRRSITRTRTKINGCELHGDTSQHAKKRLTKHGQMFTKAHNHERKWPAVIWAFGFAVVTRETRGPR
jgi:hypothetical protein